MDTKYVQCNGQLSDNDNVLSARLRLFVVTKLFELIQLAPDRNLVAAAPDSQQNLMQLGNCCFKIKLHLFDLSVVINNQ